MKINENYHPELKKYIEDLEEIITKDKPEEVVTKEVAERTKELLKHDNILLKELMQPNPDKYVMYPVYIADDERFSIAAAVWDVGQSTPIHDHGTWGVIGIVQGVEHEIQYVPSGDGKKIERKGDILLKEREVTICCTSDQDLHEVSCASSIPCVGLHIYGGNIGKIKRRTYDKETGETKYFVSEWSIPSKSS